MTPCIDFKESSWRRQGTSMMTPQLSVLDSWVNSSEPQWILNINSIWLIVHNMRHPQFCTVSICDDKKDSGYSLQCCRFSRSSIVSMFQAGMQALDAWRIFLAWSGTQPRRGSDAFKHARVQFFAVTNSCEIYARKIHQKPKHHLKSRPLLV